MPKTLTVGYIQFAPKLGEIDENINHITELLRKVKGADLIVLPELCTSGYGFDSKAEAKRYSEEIPKGKTIQALEEASRQYQIHLVVGISEIDHGILYNSAVFITPMGYSGKYRKNHLFNKEKLLFAPGNLKFPVFHLGDVKVGILICFDWIFPEAWRTLALKGADIICHPSNLVLENLAHRAIPVAAMTNRVYVICSNRIGQERNLKFIGGSMIVNPKGDIIRRAPRDKEEVFITTINPLDARNKMITKRNDVIRDRRPEIYEL